MMNYFPFFRNIIFIVSVALLGACSYNSRDLTEEISDSSFTAKEAQIIFEQEVLSTITRSESNDDIYYRERFMWNIGEITPEWNTAVYSRKGKLENIDVQIRSSNRYRVIQKDPQTGKCRKVKCYHKLVIIRNVEIEKESSFVVFFIATNAYSKTHKGFINEWFNNDGDMGDFSGLKIYTKLDGRIIRVNKYVDGKKVAGVYLGESKTKEEHINKSNKILEMMRNVVVQKATYRGGPITKAGEDDDSWDYGDDGDGYWDCGNGLFIDDDGDILYDSDDDGNPDSVWINDSECTSEDDDGDADELVDENSLDMYDGFDPDVDPNDNDQASSSDDSPQTISQVIGNITVTGSFQHVTNIVNKLSENKASVPMINVLLTKLTMPIKIKVVDRISIEKYKSAKAVYIHNTGVIEIKSSESEYPWALYEELFHAYQYQMDGKDWTQGDMEFEAKIFDAILFIEEGMYFQVEEAIVACFYDYYKEPNDANFEAVRDRLFLSPFGYDPDEFVVSDNSFPHLIHINDLLK